MAEPSIASLVEEVPADFRPVFLDIVALTDAFCDAHLNEEYQALCRLMAANICQPGSPVQRGKRQSWACGVVYAVGWVNFLTDPVTTPYLSTGEIADGFGVSTATLHNKSRAIREGLELVPFDPDFFLPSRLAENPLVQLDEAGGLPADPVALFREVFEPPTEDGIILPFPTQVAAKPAKKKRRKPRPKPDLLLQFRITLEHVKPPIWRRIQIKDCTLDMLHEYIQASFGWWNCHLHQFHIGQERFGDPELLDDGLDDMQIEDSRSVLLNELVPTDGIRYAFKYEYDFGDGWMHDIQFEGFKPIEKGVTYPCCLRGKRACPPEDVGGPWGYGEYCEAIADPTHERYEEFMEWRGGFDPDAFDVKEATRAMRRIG